MSLPVMVPRLPLARCMACLLIPLMACPANNKDETGWPDLGPADDPLWDPRGMPIFRLTFAESDWETMLWSEVDIDDHCSDKPYYTADLSFENPESGETEQYEDVAVRLRGHSGLDLENEFERAGLKLDFDNLVDGREFHGVEHINLLGTEGDYSLMREHLALWLMRAMDVPAPRSTYALLYVNDVFQGLFPHTEEPDDQAYLDAHFDDASGNLYKVKGYCGQDGDFEWDGDDPAVYVETFEPKAGTEDAAISDDLIPLMKCVNHQDGYVFETCIDDLIDVDEWLTHIAVDNVLPDVDGMGNAGQNFMLYKDPQRSRLLVYPWDKDLALSTSNAADGDDAGIYEVLAPWRSTFDPLLVRQLVATYREAYCQTVLDVAELYDPDVLVAELEDLRSFMAPYITRDPFMDSERWGWLVDDVAETIQTRHPHAVDLAQTCAP